MFGGSMTVSGMHPQEVLMKKSSIFLLLFFGAALLVSLVVTPGGTRAADGSKIAIVYSGNLLGYTEPCG